MRGKGKRTRSWEKRLSETRSPQAEGGGISDSSRANKHGVGVGGWRKGRLEELQAWGPHFIILQIPANGPVGYGRGSLGAPGEGGSGI